MSLFDFLTSTQEKLLEQQQKFVEKTAILSKKIESLPEQSNNNLKEKLQPFSQKSNLQRSSKLEREIIKTFYMDYPEKPYISSDRDKNWIDRARMMPSQLLVPKDMMTRFNDGLLPGHIYMLYWLKSYTGKNVPLYFEYKYGIDFPKEKLFLQNTGYLNDASKPTEKGEKALRAHYDVIESHKQSNKKSDRSIEAITNQILKQKASFMRNGFTMYEYIANRDCCDICKELNGKHFKVSEMRPGQNAPPMHDGCKCSVAPWEDSEEYEAWMDYLSKGGTTAQWEARGKAKWLKSKK